MLLYRKSRDSTNKQLQLGREFSKVSGLKKEKHTKKSVSFPHIKITRENITEKTL